MADFLFYGSQSILAAVLTGLLTGRFVVPYFVRYWPPVIIVNSPRIIFILAALTSVPFWLSETLVGTQPHADNGLSPERRLVLWVAWVVFVLAVSWSTRRWVTHRDD